MTDGQSASRIPAVATNPRRQPAEVRREQILDAAAAVMLRQGLHQATIADIADAAALGKGTVYLQFESKQELVAGLRRRYVKTIEDEVQTHVAEAATVADKLSAFVGSFVTASTRDPDLHHLLFQEAGVDEAEAFSALRAMFADVVRGDASTTSGADLAIDYTLAGIHAAAIAVAHMPKNRRSRAISQIVELATQTIGSAVMRRPDARR
jgi:AcrR family transcriptional regulator